MTRQDLRAVVAGALEWPGNDDCDISSHESLNSNTYNHVKPLFKSLAFETSQYSDMDEVSQ